ncbi:hypothetical protein BN2475_950073 [Paraburkholderia ribeironis]|uniref:Uncharacterized protein n=1 Tax=Paraburkholderia ribeironis TaxID=1247936 RepID=A0A1N7SLK2_9BURK|nr:hypothetical protein BN2475_950073 [Paraburkholderia ribeironis]
MKKACAVRQDARFPEVGWRALHVNGHCVSARASMPRRTSWKAGESGAVGNVVAPVMCEVPRVCRATRAGKNQKRRQQLHPEPLIS